jgi:hypothetical protein
MTEVPAGSTGNKEIHIINKADQVRALTLQNENIQASI